MNSTSCKICGNTVGLNGFSKHLKTYHNISCVKDYYDQYMKTELEGLCKTCGKPTKFKILTEGYAEFCCRRCASQGTVARRQQTCLKRYGAEHPMHVEEFREKVSAKLCKDVHKYEAKLPKDHTCQICRKQFSSRGMGQHLQKTHRVSVKDYYDQYLKKPKEGLCKTCGKPTAFRTFTSGYSSYCCQYCTTQDPEVAQRASQTRKKRSTERVLAWLSTEEGQQAMQRVIDHGTPFSDKIAEARRINPDYLRIPLSPDLT